MQRWRVSSSFRHGIMGSELSLLTRRSRRLSPKFPFVQASPRRTAHHCGVTMNKGLLAVALTLGLIPAAFGQSEQEQQEACMDDAFKFCGQAIPDRQKVFYCLLENRHSIAPRCQ